MTQELLTPQSDGSYPKLRYWIRTRVPAIALIGLVAVTYYSAIWADFIWNDTAQVAQSAPLLSIDGLKQAWLDIGSFPQYRPLVHTSFWLEYQLLENLSYGYHAVNILIHAISVVILWRILGMLKVPGAWFAAAIFAVHPVNVESVAWITQRENLLCGLFYLSTLWAYLDWANLDRSLPEESPCGRWWLYGLSLVLFVCALLCNPAACTLPFVLAAILWWKNGRVTRGDLARVSPFFALALAMWLSTVLMVKPVMGTQGSAWDLSPLGRVLVAGQAVWFYAWKLVWPRPLVFIYPLWQVDASQALQYVPLLGIAVLLLVLWLARSRIGRGTFAATVIFLITLLPGLGFFKFYPMLSSFVSDNFLYLAGIPLIALLVASIWSLAAGNRAAVAIRMATGIGLVVVLMLLTTERCLVFRNSESLCLDTLAKNPQAWMAHNHLGLVRWSQGNAEGAMRGFEAALELRPESVNAQNNMGSLLLSQGRIEKATEHFEEAIRIEPDFIGARLSICKLLGKSGKVPEAMPHYLHALRLDSRVAYTHGHIAMDLLVLADHRSACEFFDEAIGANEDWPLMLNAMAWMLATHHDAERHDPQRAVELASRANELTNNADSAILDTLAAAHARAGDFDEACETQRRALEIVKRHRNARLFKEFGDRLRLFEEGKAYVEPKRWEAEKRDVGKGDMGKQDMGKGRNGS